MIYMLIILLSEYVSCSLVKCIVVTEILIQTDAVNFYVKSPGI